MNAKRIGAAMTLLLMACFLVAIAADQVEAAAAPAAPAAGAKPAAAGAAPQGKSSMMERKGIEGVFAGAAGYDANKDATPIQKWIGIGSFVVMIAVVKYL